MKSKAIIFLLVLSLLIPLASTKAAATNNLNGKILLQVESKGEAWYVNPKDGKRYYMANGDQAFQIMKTLGVGMNNKDVDKMKTDANFRKKFIGKILLQVESHGEAYYISFDGRYNYLKDGASAYEVMRKLGLGISNINLNKIIENKVGDNNKISPSTLVSREVTVGGKKLIIYSSSDIKITYPTESTELKVGDTLTIKVHISNVKNLVSLMLLFQEQVIEEKPSVPDLEFKFIVNGEFIENQYVSVVGGFYDNGKSYTSEDYKLVKITPVESIKEFNIKQEVIMIAKGNSSKPDYEVIFPTAIAHLGTTDLLQVSIKDKNLLSYDSKTNYFTALSEGSTIAYITYRGITKYVFFEIISNASKQLD